MFEIPITFKAPKAYIENNKDILPIPSKLNIPQWFKKLGHDISVLTVKGCVPFLESLTAGYILKCPTDYSIEHNTILDGKKICGFTTPINREVLGKEFNLNYHGEKQMHNIEQLEGSPLVEKNMNQPFHKIMNPWVIKTPPGYSCLFVPPLNNTDDRFSIIPAIVDTDTFKIEINFPIVINGDKYKSLKTTIERGTPLVQIIPFKREKWKSSLGVVEPKKMQENIFRNNTVLRDYYRNLVRGKYGNT